MKRLIVFAGLFLLLGLSGCTYSVILTATHGKASDVVDETATNSPEIRANVDGAIPGIASVVKGE